jgi:hypothetical protein
MLSRLAGGLFLVVPFLLGCSSEPSVGAVPVTGTVTLDGKPVEGATISFVPDGDSSLSASGLTDASGNFRLTSVSPGDGAVPGKYKVTVSKLTADSQAAPQATSQEEAMKQLQDKMKAGGSNAFYTKAPPPVKETLPERYSNAATSGLQAEVKGSGENKFTFALTTAG